MIHVKDIIEDDSFIGGQGHIAQNHDKSSGDQERQIKKVSQVGAITHTEKESAARGGAAQLPRSFAAWLNQETKTIGLPRISSSTRVFLRVRASVAYRTNLRAQRAQL